MAGNDASGGRGWVLWGSELSPFALKLEALLRFTGVPFQWMPATAGFFDALRVDRRRRRLVVGRLRDGDGTPAAHASTHTGGAS